MGLNLLSGTNSEKLNILDWDTLCNQISAAAYFQQTKKIIYKTPSPIKSGKIIFLHDALELFLSDFHSYNEIIQSSFQYLSFENLYYDHIKKLSKGGILDLAQINQLCLLFESFLSFKNKFSHFKYIDYLFPESKILSRIKNKFASPFRKFIKYSGEINYAGHPLLNEYQNKLFILEKSLRDDMRTMCKNTLYKDCLAFDQFDIKNDHYVLAVKSDCYSYEHGPIIDKSQSGQTLFVEPFSLRLKCDQRLKLLAKIDEIISKICSQFCEILQPDSDSFHNLFTIIEKLDLLNCKADFCYKKNLTRPTLSEDFVIDIQGFFHPLIDNPVLNSVTISSKQDGLIISGPNTGGKTVTLKSLAISHLFLHMGLFIPATKAILCPIDHIFFLGNEGQDLSQGLSSFALESKNYLDIYEKIEGKNLIIIDEIFNSTSSEEASALAISLFEEITKISDTKFLVSTHHQLLKTSIHANNNFLSAHVGFDLDNKKPTYKLYTDGPGSSLAFTIFENLSKEYKQENSIAKKAKSVLSSKQVSYDDLLQQLSKKRTDLDKLLTENRDLNYQLKNQKKSMEGVLYLEKQEVHRLYKNKLKTILDKADALRSNAIDLDKISKKKFVDTKANLIHELVAQKMPTKDSTQIQMPSGLIPIIFDNISVGQKLYSKKFKKEVHVTKLNIKKKQVHIKAGALGVWSNISDLYFHHSHLKREKSVTIHIQRSQTGQIETDCRGMRLDEFEKIAENCINDLLAGNIPYAVLIHGHGTGVLKTWLRDLIKKEYPQIIWDAPNGNDGCTNMKLKDEN